MKQNDTLPNTVNICVTDFCRFLPPALVTPAQHLFTWLTPERQQLINAIGCDRALGIETSRLSRFIKKAKYMTLERAGVEDYYPILRLLGYTPDLDLEQDESVQRYKAGDEPFAHIKKRN